MTQLAGSQPMRSLGPENVAIVVNADSWASQALADAYVHLRGIPAQNVIALGGLSHFERIGVDEFRTQILAPILSTIETRGLRDVIDCLAYSADIPYAIDFRADLGDRDVDPYVGHLGALTGMTYLHEAVMADAEPGYTSLTSNRYARRAYVDAPDAPLCDAEEAAWLAIRQLRREKAPDAIPALSDFCACYPRRAFAHYVLACALAVDGAHDAALAALSRALDTGWWNTPHADADTDLEALRALPAYAALRERMEQNRRRLTVQPTCPFQAQTAWDAAGMPTTGSDGRRYLLSIMLGVTSGRGTSVREAVAALARAAAADGTRPAGTIYYLVNGDVRSRTRQWGFDAAVRLLREADVAAVIEEGALPQGRPDVAGAMIGIAAFDVAASGSRLLPGAICEHLTSLGGVMTWAGGQTALTELLRHGAAGASGTVAEPYAIQAKFPDPFLHVHYISGASLVEAFYQSVAAPYQLLIVGDPLCRPWGTAQTTTSHFTFPAMPSPVAATPRPRPATLQRGFRVITGEKARAIHDGNAPQSWWDTDGVKPNARLRLEGFIETPTHDTYQFQVFSTGKARVNVGGQALSSTGNGHWQMFPVTLDAGWHAVKISIIADKTADTPPDLRFGAAGVSPLIPQLFVRAPRARSTPQTTPE